QGVAGGAGPPVSWRAEGRNGILRLRQHPGAPGESAVPADLGGRRAREPRSRRDHHEGSAQLPGGAGVVWPTLQHARAGTRAGLEILTFPESRAPRRISARHAEACATNAGASKAWTSTFLKPSCTCTSKALLNRQRFVSWPDDMPSHSAKKK